CSPPGQWRGRTSAGGAHPASRARRHGRARPTGRARGDSRLRGAWSRPPAVRRVVRSRSRSVLPTRRSRDRTRRDPRAPLAPRGATPLALAERVRWQLDGWLSDAKPHGPTAGLTLLRLAPEEVLPDEGRQLGFWGGDRALD